MTDIRIKDVKHLDSTPPEGAKPATSVMTLEAEVDATPQPLKTIRPYAVTQKEVPGSIAHEGQIVLHSLFACFDRQKSVQEGLIGDLIWGFAQAGIPPQLTLVGLKILEKNGYVKFQAPDHSYVDLNSDKIESAWVRYQKKLLDMVYEK